MITGVTLTPLTAATIVLAVSALGTAPQPSPEEIDAAIGAYLRCEDLDCAPHLRTLLDKGPAAVPRLAALVEKGPAPELRTALPGDGRVVAIVRAARALGAFGDVRATAALAGASRDASPLVRAAVADALGRTGGPKALPALETLLDDGDDLVRETSAHALGRLADPAAIAALTRAAEREPKAHVRKAMSGAIESLGRRRPR